jgi:pyroglutamyl-peptidase
MRRKRPVILLTGFGPFPGAPLNASSLLTAELARRAPSRVPGYVVHAETLPTEWAAGPSRLAELMDTLDPAVALHFGVSHRARGFVVETRARNVCEDIADACGAAPETPCIAEQGPSEMPATLPTGLIVERLRRMGLPVQLSRDAGGYLCNSILYHSLSLARRRGASSPIGENAGSEAVARGSGVRRGFIHIPDTLARSRGWGARRASSSMLDWDDALAGGLAVVELAAAVGMRSEARDSRLASMR